MKEILIYLMSITSFVYWWKDCDNYKIAYTTPIDTIVRVCRQEEFTNEVKLHELGHIFFYQVMTEKEREKWINDYNFSLTLTWTLWQRWFVNYKTIGDYNEDFAETFTYIFYHQKDNRKTKSIKKIIKNFKEYKYSFYFIFYIN